LRFSLKGFLEKDLSLRAAFAMLRVLIMGNLNVAVLGSPDYSSKIAKKGTSTDITLFNLKRGEDTVTLIEPTRYPERFAPLFYAVSLAKKALLVVEEVNANFGESAVLLMCSKIQEGYIILRNYLTIDKIAPFIKGTKLEKYQVIPDDPNALRERLLNDAAQQKPAETKPAGTVPVDHAFNVKGVGVVVLGVVTDGSVKKHDAMKVLPGTKTAQIRSIQKHDDEFEEAVEGDRVGFALKGVAVEDVERGVVLTTDANVKTTKTLTVPMSLVKYWQTPIKPGMILHVGYWMQFLNAKVESVAESADWRNTTLKLSLDRELAFLSGEQAVLFYLEGGKLRVAGNLLLP
jgi:selenocysteine-specific translation elongation factor